MINASRSSRPLTGNLLLCCLAVCNPTAATVHREGRTEQPHRCCNHPEAWQQRMAKSYTQRAATYRRVCAHVSASRPEPFFGQSLRLRYRPQGTRKRECNHADTGHLGAVIGISGNMLVVVELPRIRKFLYVGVSRPDARRQSNQRQLGNFSSFGDRLAYRQYRNLAVSAIAAIGVPNTTAQNSSPITIVSQPPCSSPSMLEV